MDNWFSLNWFSYKTLSNFTWEFPLFLYLPIVISLFYLIKLLYSPQSTTIKLSFLNRPKSNLASLLQAIPKIVLLLSFTMISMAMSNPCVQYQKIIKKNLGIDILLAIDISPSMKIFDLPPNRLEAAKKVAHTFVSNRKNDRIGIIVFSGEAFTLSPLTTDHQSSINAIDQIDFDMIQKEGTAISDALALSIAKIKNSKSVSKVIILLSDGEDTAGALNPEQVAQLAKENQIKIYSILIGQAGKVPASIDSTGKIAYEDNRINPQTLINISQISNGKFFEAPRQGALEEIFTQISQMEKTLIIEEKITSQKSFASMYIIWAILFLLLFLFLKNTFISNILRD